jgi:trans-2,3-dihydro-3-hydroxyanthranilate isomerase
LLKSYRYLHLDVFTDRIFGGNQLAVVMDGRGLSTGAMQAIAKEMNFSETTFVLPPERRDTDARVRIFTPAEELPMAGHPTIGTVYALARAGVVAPPVDSLTLGLGVGPTPVSLEWKGEELSFVWPRGMPSTAPSSTPRRTNRSAARLASTTSRFSCSRPSQAPITAPCTAACSHLAPASPRIRPPAVPAARRAATSCTTRL